jgi:GNAT superfamily N-acetyltransferase
VERKTVTIRAATPEDADRVVRAYEWLFEPPGTRPSQWDERRAAAALRRVIAGNREIILVAQTDVELAGICSVYLDIESIRFGQRAWIEDLAVDPRQRSLGIGKALLDRAKDWARTHGATHLELDSAEARAAAHRFYEREQPSWRSICFGWQP